MNSRLTIRRNSIVLAAAVAIWVAPMVFAQALLSTDAADLKALAAEFTSRPRGGGRSAGVLPTLDQAMADSSWAGAFLARLRTLQPDRLTHDEWITYAR